MTTNGTSPLAVEIAEALRTPFVPDAIARLAAVPGYLEHAWPQLAPSVETAGFLGSALYMADMSLDAVEAVYEPAVTREALLEARAATDEELEHLAGVLDAFHWGQPQVLLRCSALAEAWDKDQVGGQGRPDPRQPSEREEAHLATEVTFATTERPPLPEIAEALGLAEPPQLYRAVATWPGYLEAVWDELQHMVAYPDFRRRGRALYYYARSSSRFLAQPIEVNQDALADAGMDEGAIEQARKTLDAVLPELATMTMHNTSMRFGLGIRTREVVRPE
jgi:hypothetical protein